MKRGRGRPPVYENATQQPTLVALRIPRPLEARLRQEASEGGRTMTDILLQSLVFRWEHANAAEELSLARQQLSELQRQYTVLEERHTRLRDDFTRAQRERDTAQEEAERYKNNPFRRLLDTLDMQRSALPDEVRRDLLKLCHPDKWSQGQPASELAHELTVRLTSRPK